MSTLRHGTIVLAIAAGAFLLVRLVAQPDDSISGDTNDIGCHDLNRLFADSGSRVSAKFSLELVATNDDWPEVVRVIQSLAQQHEWSFRNTSKSLPPVETLELSVCAPGQPIVSVNEQRWGSRNRVDQSMPPERNAIGFAFYGDAKVTEQVWQPVAADLVAMLEARWPNAVRFRDENSYLTERRPNFLRPATSTSSQ